MGLILLTPEECTPPQSPAKEATPRKRPRAGACAEVEEEFFLAPPRATTPTPVARAGSPPPLSSASSSASDASRISVQSKGSVASNRSRGSSMCSIAPPQPSKGKRARGVVMPPRGLRALVKRTAPGAFSKGKFPCFRLTAANGRATGPKMRGITKRLAERLFSRSALVQGPGQWRGGAWAGEGGGLRRGKAVDAQVSRLAKLSEAARRGSKMLKLTRLAFAALRYHDLDPVEAQRVVLDAGKGLGTAADVVCVRGGDELVLVELKCGFPGNRSEPAVPRAMMGGPLHRAVDCALHRHLAQLAATVALFKAEKGTLRALAAKGVTRVSGVLLYVNDDATEVHELPDWWERRGAKILEAIR